MDCFSEEQQSLLLTNKPYKSHSDGTGMGGGSGLKVTYIQTHAYTHAYMHTHMEKRKALRLTQH